MTNKDVKRRQREDRESNRRGKPKSTLTLLPPLTPNARTKSSTQTSGQRVPPLVKVSELLQLLAKFGRFGHQRVQIRFRHNVR